MLASKQYAKAMDANPCRDWLDVLNTLTEISKSDIFKNLLKNPFVSSEKLEALIFSFYTKLSQAQKNIIKLLVKNKRMGEIASIISHYKEIQLQKEKKQEVQVTTAQKATPKQRKMIESYALVLGEKEKSLVFQYHIDADLIGGFILNLDGYIIDKSVKARLYKIGHYIKGI